MKNHSDVINWATDFLISKDYFLEKSPEIIQDTPWSAVIKFSTVKGDIYLKQTPPSIFMEPKIIQLLQNKLHASVPVIIAVNAHLHCFLMENGGESLRQYLKTHFQPELMCEAIQEFATIQRSAETRLNSFFSLGVPDWRIEHLPELYNQFINQADILSENGMTNKEIQILHTLSNKVLEECEMLSQYHIQDTLVQPDFNTNNMLFDSTHGKMTLIDLGEIAITHPFFSLHNFLYQATIHHNVKTEDSMYQKLENSYYESWVNCATRSELRKIFRLTKKLWHIYGALAYHRLMISVDLEALKTFYSNRPNALANSFRQYIETANS